MPGIKHDQKVRTVLITGAATGIGLEIARAFLHAGHQVALNDVSEPALRHAATVIAPDDQNGRLLLVPGDVSSESSVRDVVNNAVSRFGGFDTLVNNAGIITRSPTEDTSLQDWSRVLAVNLTGTFLMGRQCIPVLRKARDPRIVNVSSRAAKRPHRNAAPSYGATKAAIIYLTRHWALEWAPIPVNAICPGPVETDMFRQMDHSTRERVQNEIPLGRVARPAEIAELVMFLCSPAAGYITGESININGGSFMD